MKYLLIVVTVFVPFAVFCQVSLDTLIKITNIETSYPSWSPDGRQLVVQSNRNDDDSEIYLMNDKGEGLRRLTFRPGLDEYPAFSPDGEKIVFVSKQDENQDIFMMSLDGTNLTNLTNHPEKDIHPQFSPDGSDILFNSNRTGNFDLYLIDIKGNDIVQLTSSPDDETYAHWSPDGRAVVFVKWLKVPDGDRRLGEIFTLDIETREEKRLTNNSSFDGWPSWSPDGDKVIFASNRQGGTFQIYTMNVDGTGLEKITNGELEKASFTKPVFAKDGSSRVACTRTKDGNIEVFIIQ